MRTLGYFFCPWKHKKLASKVAYFSFCSAVLVLPKSAQSAQTVENPDRFFNVSYTWYKSLLVSCSILSKTLASGGGTPFCFCLNIHVMVVDKSTLQCNDYTSSENVCMCTIFWRCWHNTFIFFDWELGMPIHTTIIFIGLFESL